MNKLPELNDQNKQNLLSKSFYTLPDNPSDKGFSASQIKKKGYEGLLVLFDYIKTVIEKINDLVDANDTDVADIDTLESYFSSGKALKAIADEDNNNIKASYGDHLSHALLGNASQWTYKVSLYSKTGVKLDEESQVFGSATTSNAGLMSADDKAKVDAISDDIDTALGTAEDYTDTEVEKLLDGTYTADKASKDGSGNNIVTTYETKTDANAKVARANLVSVIGEATQSLGGLMSDTDKTRLDTLFALLGDEADADTVVNTINEVLAILDQYPEGADLVSALALKANVADVADLANPQTVTGTKTFQGDLKFQGVNSGTPYTTIGFITTMSNQVRIGYDGVSYVVASGSAFYTTFNGQYDLGSSGSKWKDLYLSGELKDGTNSISIANIVNTNSLLASDSDIADIMGE